MKKLQTKIISVLLLLAMLLPLSVFHVAAEEESELQNVSLFGTAYASSIKNPAWTPAEAINDHQPDNWQGWEPLYPTGIAGAAGLSGEYCGLKFDTFYEIYGASMKLRNAASQDITYEIQALIMGQWVTIYTLHDHDYEGMDTLPNGNSFVLECTFEAPVNTNNVRVFCSDYARNYGGGDELIFPYIYELELYGKEGLTPSVIVPENYAITSNIALAGKVTASSASQNHWPALAINNDETDDPWKAAADDETASIGVILNEAFLASEIVLNFGKDTTAIPYFVWATAEDGNGFEIANGTVADGKTFISVTEESALVSLEVVFDGLGAQMQEISVLSSYNAALDGTVSASSETEGFEAAKLNTEDGLWKASEADASLSVLLAEATLPSGLTIDFGADAAEIPYVVTVTCENGSIVTLLEGTASAEPVSVDMTDKFANTGTFIVGVDVSFTGEGAQIASLAVNADNFAFYYDVEPSDEYKQSCAKGNLAILGTAYASSNFPDYSKISYINDGLIKAQNPSWYAHGFAVPAYCGVTLDQTYVVNKVALTFDYIDPKGSAIMYFDIQARVDGEYVTVASGRSYDSACNYQPVFVFDPVVTDDIRIVFTKNGGIFPNLRELEVYSDVDFPAPYRGYPTNYPIGGRAVTEFKDDPNTNRIYETTVRYSNPPMLGSTAKRLSVNVWPGVDSNVLTTAAASSLPAVTSPIVQRLSASKAGDISSEPILTIGATEPEANRGPWIVTAIVFAVCAAVVIAYAVIKRKKI